MVEDEAVRRIKSLERADILSQIRFWIRIYDQPRFEPDVPRLSVTDFYDSLMPRFTQWLHRQMLVAGAMVVVIGLVFFGFKVVRDHVVYQDQVIAEQQRLLELEVGNKQLANWFANVRPGTDLDLYISSCVGCESYREAELTEYSFERIDQIDVAVAGKGRFINRGPGQVMMAAIGVIAGYILVRSMLAMWMVVGASRRLNDLLLDNDPSFRRLG